jgi:transketolase
VAEQNMIGLATGLADAGLIPYVYSIVTFATMRAYEFFRNGPIVHGLPVRLVGMGGGVEYGHNGISHFGLEDIAIMRVQPSLTVVAPADAAQTHTVMSATWDLPGPVYIRLGKDDRLHVPGLEGRFRLGRAETVRDGSEVLLVAMGGIAAQAVAAADDLARRDVLCTVMIVASLNPAPADDIAEAAVRHRLVVTVESHYLVGGLGSLVAEIIAERGTAIRLVRCGVEKTPDRVSGSQAAMEHSAGLSSSQIAATVMAALEGPAA